MLPLAKHLHDKGSEVLFECKEEYKDIFNCVSYVKYKPIDAMYQNIDFIFNRQIWPWLYDEYRKSGLKWERFVYGSFCEEAIGQKIILDILPEAKPIEEYNLVAPFGISQVNRVEPTMVIKKALRMYGLNEMLVLCPTKEIAEGLVGCRGHHCESIVEMISLIKNAKNFLGINSSPAVIASAVRDQYDWIADGSFDGQDDYGDWATRVYL
jgi:hypothetical protein